VGAIRLAGVAKRYGADAYALAPTDLEVRDGELLVLVGPSGCGKSTLLRLVAGLETPSDGRVWIGGADVTDVDPGRRDVAMVFQSYALYPHKSVRENIAFGLRMRGRPAPEIARSVAQVAERLGLTPLLDRRPAALSGGERQRTALARALAREPAAFLLDEPLSNLDARLRQDTRVEIARLHSELGATMLYVTHDQEEAMTLGQRVAVLRAGRLQQVDPPRTVYAAPVNTFVAGFFGSPPMNLLPGECLAGARAAGRLAGFRPEHVEPDAPDAGPAGVVETVEELGPSRILHVRLEGDGAQALRVRLRRPATDAARGGDRLGLRIAPDALHWFDAASGERTGAP